jgi:hypothetical protein
MVATTVTVETEELVDRRLGPEETVAMAAPAAATAATEAREGWVADLAATAGLAMAQVNSAEEAGVAELVTSGASEAAVEMGATEPTEELAGMEVSRPGYTTAEGRAEMAGMPRALRRAWVGFTG